VFGIVISHCDTGNNDRILKGEGEDAAMEIDRQNNPLHLDSIFRSTQDALAQPAASGARKDGKGTDKVVLSPRAREVREATRELTRDATVNDASTVQGIRERIDAGTYEIKSGRIAMAMITESILDQTV